MMERAAGGPRLLTIDIETAPHHVYAWGLHDQDIHYDNIVQAGHTICFSARWRGERAVQFYSIPKHGRAPMVRAAHRLLDEADAVIHFNGSKFDIPILNQEFFSRRMKPPSPFQQIDLYLVAKSRFRLPSNSMSYVAKVLGLRGKTPHKGMDLWKECMAGREAAWRVMERYNKRDVALADEIYDAMLPWIKRHPNLGLWHADDRPRCTNCGSAHVVAGATRRTLTMAYRRFQCMDCGKWLRGRRNIEPRKNLLVDAG